MQERPTATVVSVIRRRSLYTFVYYTRRDAARRADSSASGGVLAAPPSSAVMGDRGPWRVQVAGKFSSRSYVPTCSFRHKIDIHFHLWCPVTLNENFVWGGWRLWLAEPCTPSPLERSPVWVWRRGARAEIEVAMPSFRGADSLSYLQFVGLRRSVMIYSDVELVFRPLHADGLLLYRESPAKPHWSVHWVEVSPPKRGYI